MDSPRPFPDKDKYVFKPAFEARYQQLLGDSYQTFIDFSLSFKRRGIRVNTLKISTDDLKKRLANDWTLAPVPWYPDAFWIDHKGTADNYRRDVGNLREHVLGYIYIQDPASTIPPLVLAPTKDDRVLDMCAAPGSKTTQLSQLMENKGIIVANEMIGSRIAALGVNCMRCGTQNVVITQQDARKIKHGDFTKILLDAPCSGTGTIRKSPRTINEWNPSVITKLAHHNLGLLAHAWSLLAPGGTLVYSTCTLEPEENEGVISAFLSSTPDAKMQPITLSIKRSAALTSFGKETYHPDVTHCLRIYPQDNDTEGFFVAKLCKQA